MAPFAGGSRVDEGQGGARSTRRHVGLEKDVVNGELLVRAKGILDGLETLRKDRRRFVGDLGLVPVHEALRQGDGALGAMERGLARYAKAHLDVHVVCATTDGSNTLGDTPPCHLHRRPDCGPSSAYFSISFLKPWTGVVTGCLGCRRRCLRRVRRSERGRGWRGWDNGGLGQESKV